MEVMRLDEMTEEMIDRLFDKGCLMHQYVSNGEDFVYIIHPFAYDIVED